MRVIKLGGSLLEWPEWPARFREWFGGQPAIASLLICGGGARADEVRRQNRLEGLKPSLAHELAIRAMSKNTCDVGTILAEGAPVVGFDGLADRLATGGLIIFEPLEFLAPAGPIATGQPIPESWDVTSDSLAARLAEVLGAEELVLLKSTLPPPTCATLSEAAAFGYVDRSFPQFAARLPPVRCVNLRANPATECRLDSASLAAGVTL